MGFYPKKGAEAVDNGNVMFAMPLKNVTANLSHGVIACLKDQGSFDLLGSMVTQLEQQEMKAAMSLLTPC